MDLLPGLRSQTIATERLSLHYLESGPADGEPVVFLHGNLATSRFDEPLLAGLPARYHGLAPDMRGFGATDRVPIDATRGLRDWADDTAALLRALGIDRPAPKAESTDGDSLNRSHIGIPRKPLCTSPIQVGREPL